VLTPLQEQVASIVAGLAEAENFALAGGAALIARGDSQRQTQIRTGGGAGLRRPGSGGGSHGLDRLFELAAEKDHGFTPEMFAEMAGRFSRLRPDEFGLDPGQYEQLERKVLEWQQRAGEG
jgi:hypothetical protein